MKNLFIGPSVRSGGSLINRLLDHHPDIAAYPFELFLPMDDALHSSLKNRGQKLNVQNFPRINTDDHEDIILSKMLLDRDPSKCLIGKHFKNGKLIAKTTGLDVEGAFDHNTFISGFLKEIKNVNGIGNRYNILHKNIFKLWDSGKHSGKMKFVTYHSGNGLMADIENYFDEFPDSYFIQPIRDVRGYLASEKKKVFRQIIGRGRIGRRFNWPDWMLKKYYGRYFEAMLVNWLITVTRSVILKKKIGERYVIYRHEDLIRNTKSVMTKLSDAIGLAFDDCLLNPTVGGVGWRGNSMFGLQSGVNPELAKVRDVFNTLEENLIEKYCNKILSYMTGFENELVNYDSFDTSTLFDYDIQMKYYDDRDKTALYFASMYERWGYESFYNNVKMNIKMTPKPIFLGED